MPLSLSSTRQKMASVSSNSYLLHTDRQSLSPVPRMSSIIKADHNSMLLFVKGTARRSIHLSNVCGRSMNASFSLGSVINMPTVGRVFFAGLIAEGKMAESLLTAARINYQMKKDGDK